MTESVLENTELFPVAPEVIAPSGLYVDIVFDRPLDHAYTYGVPESLANEVGIGKRVEAPFGKGDKSTTGYCVGVHRQTPIREVKFVTRVVDREALLTEPLLRLTRWMADYYVCAWGQVLQAVLPAGVRSAAGIRPAIFVEAAPELAMPEPRPTLTCKQSTAFEVLRETDEPIEIKELARLAKCGP